MLMAAPRTWDIFCRVVDNYGDIGVCWRLARQLVREHDGAVRLWVDKLAALHALCPEADPASARQWVEGVEVCRWSEHLPRVAPADAVVEAFGCGLPDTYAQAAAARQPPSLWIVLEYLSAEPWVKTVHGLPSPHPRLPVTRLYVCPGFEAGTGGILREKGLEARRDAFGDRARRRFWEQLGYAAPAADVLSVSLFAYESAPVRDLLAAWEEGPEPVVVAVPQGGLTRTVRAHFGARLAADGNICSRGRLEARLLPFLPQSRFDALLWACDVNFVRGEDSFVRAQLAARPLVWQPYPQQERAHLRKLEAFLHLYCAGLAPAAAAAVRALWESWNVPGAPAGFADAWSAFRKEGAALAAHARAWADRLASLDELVAVLARIEPNGVK
jgi:uncharacterized repeat protein (TIGR03837 family)